MGNCVIPNDIFLGVAILHFHVRFLHQLRISVGMQVVRLVMTETTHQVVLSALA